MTHSAAIEVGLGFGSNQGDRIAQFRAAKKAVLALPGISLMAQSSLYETEPVGVKPEYQHMKFINSVLVVSVQMPLADFHQRMLAVEAELGRKRTSDQFAPRPLDIDILFAGDLVSNEPGLRLPHPQCFKRRFVLAPLAEINPARVLPSAGKNVQQLLESLAGEEQVVRLPDPW